MKYLVQGMESKKKIELLISATKIKRDKLVDAIFDHYCRDFDIASASVLNGIKQPNLTAACNTLNEVAEKFEKYFEIRTYELSSINKNKEIK